MPAAQLANRWGAPAALPLPQRLRCTGLVSASANALCSAPLSPKAPVAHELPVTDASKSIRRAFSIASNQAAHRLGQTKSGRSVTWNRQGIQQEALSGAERIAGVEAAPTRLQPSPQLQRTARRWLAAYDNRLSQSFWSRHAETPKPLREDLCGPGPSSTACRENYKKERYSSQLDSICDPLHQDPRDILSNMQDAIDQLDKIKDGVDKAEEPRRKSKAILDAAPANEEEEFEAEELRKEERQERRRAARNRDPRYRVELRIRREQAARRQVGDNTLTRVQHLPMRKLEVGGSCKGSETVEMVDVKMLQSKCKGLAQGCTAKMLLEAERMKDQRRKPRAVADSHRLGASHSLPALSYEERLQMVQKRKLETYVSSLLNKMSQMRGDCPKDIPDIEHHLDILQQDEFSWHENDY